MANPYSVKEEPKLHALYNDGHKLGFMDRVDKAPAKASRRWPQAYRYGYSDGFCGR